MEFNQIHVKYCNYLTNFASNQHASQFMIPYNIHTQFLSLISVHNLKTEPYTLVEIDFYVFTVHTACTTSTCPKFVSLETIY